MSDSLLILLIILGVLFLLVIYYLIAKIKKSGKNKTQKPKRIKKEKIKKIKKVESKEDRIEGSVDIGDKFLFRKEIKVLALINRVLPKGYVAFPKVGVGLILSPVGNRSLFEAVRDKYIDLVIFEEGSMKPKVAIDLFDGTIGDEQLDIESPEVLRALELAELPVLGIKVKTSYSEEEIRNPIFEILGIKDVETQIEEEQSE